MSMQSAMRLAEQGTVVSYDSDEYADSRFSESTGGWSTENANAAASAIAFQRSVDNLATVPQFSKTASSYMMIAQIMQLKLTCR